MAEQGLRVLGFAHRELAAATSQARPAWSLGAGRVADPPRPEVPEAIARWSFGRYQGDHGDRRSPSHGVAIAREIGLVTTSSPLVVHGEALRRMTAAQLQIALENPEILFTRVTAEQKMLVVQA